MEPILPDRPLYGMFTAVPPHYDLVNKIITLGLDKSWRQRAAEECLASRPEKVLDLCCGTADLAINIARICRYDIEITGVDYAQSMLDIAARKANISPRGGDISFREGDAAQLPFPDSHFNCVGVAFAIRNLTYKNPLADCHIAEIYRVLSPNGRCVIVESSQPRIKLVRILFHLYLRCYVSRIGHWLSGNKGAYNYLAESAARFYRPAELGELFLAAGFSRISYHPLFLGVAGIHIAVK